MTIVVYMIPNQTIQNSTRRNPNPTDRTTVSLTPPILTSRPSTCIKLLNLYVKSTVSRSFSSNKETPPPYPYPHPALFRERKEKKKQRLHFFVFYALGKGGGIMQLLVRGLSLSLIVIWGYPSIFPCAV